MNSEGDAKKYLPDYSRWLPFKTTAQYQPLCKHLMNAKYLGPDGISGAPISAATRYRGPLTEFKVTAALERKVADVSKGVVLGRQGSLMDTDLVAAKVTVPVDYCGNMIGYLSHIGGWLDDMSGRESVVILARVPAGAVQPIARWLIDNLPNIGGVCVRRTI